MLATMIRDPKSWRVDAGLSLAAVAARAGIVGKNPMRTYGRYERGEQPCPAEVVEAVRALSDGRVSAETWHQVRLAYLAQRSKVVPAA